MSHDYRAQIEVAFPELNDIEDDGLHDKVREAWCLGLARSGWRDIADIPYTWNIREMTNVEYVHGMTHITVRATEEQRDFHGTDPDFSVVRAACLLHDIGKCYEYVDFVNDDRLDDPGPEYASGEIPHSLLGYALARGVDYPLAVQHAIPRFIGEVPIRTLEVELVKSVNSTSSNAVTQVMMGISLREWVEEYS